MLTRTKIAFVISALLAGAALSTPAAATSAVHQFLARHGADDGAGDDRGGRGNPAIEVKELLARNGGDDGAGDDHGTGDDDGAGDDHGGRA